MSDQLANYVKRRSNQCQVDHPVAACHIDLERVWSDPNPQVCEEVQDHHKWFAGKTAIAK